MDMVRRVLASRFGFVSKFLFIEYQSGSIKQIAKYTIVGTFNNSLGYSAYLAATHFGATPKMSMTLLYCLGAAVGYFGNRNFTFSHNGHWLASSVRYLVAHFFGYVLNLCFLIIFVDYLSYPHQLVQAISIFVVAIFLFLIFRFFVFAKEY